MAATTLLNRWPQPLRHLKYAGEKAIKSCVRAHLSPRRHRRLPSDDDPRPLSTLAQQRVKLSAAYCDGTAVGEGHRATSGINGLDQIVFRGEIGFDE
jgi:hypothetical protein